jgi:hypothetical protein
MDNNLNDILKDIETDIDITDIYEAKEIKAKKISNKSTNDIISNLENIDL